MKCKLCNGTGFCKKANDERAFDRIVDTEMEKGDFKNMEMIMEKAYKQVGYTLIECPNCKNKNK